MLGLRTFSVLLNPSSALSLYLREILIKKKILCFTGMYVREKYYVYCIVHF